MSHMTADRILLNGRIVTMDQAETTVEAVALSGDRWRPRTIMWSGNGNH